MLLTFIESTGKEITYEVYTLAIPNELLGVKWHEIVRDEGRMHLVAECTFSSTQPLREE